MALSKRAASLKGASWRHATKRTVAQLRAVFALRPELTEQDKRIYIQRAQTTADRLILLLPEPDRTVSKYWGICDNTLRILIASTAKRELPDLFPDRENDDRNGGYKYNPDED